MYVFSSPIYNGCTMRRVGILVFAASVTAQAADLKLELQSLFSQACESGKFMGAASLSIDGKSVFQGACGWADAEWQVKNTSDTRFSIASITKEFTAAAVLLLYEEKKFSLTDPVGKYVPNLPEAWQSATIHQLLTHTSGVPIYTATADYKQENPDLKRLRFLGDIPSELLSLVRDRPLMFEHGSEFRYNNSGYILLGMLVERLSGVSYPEFIQKRIFDRLGMHDSGYDDGRKIVRRKARGYALSGKELQTPVFADPREAWSAGALYSTVSDLTLWSGALGHGTLLNPDSTDRMLRVYPEAVSQDPYKVTAHYGYGLVLIDRLGHKLQYHGGGINGFNSVLQRYPEVNVVIAVLSNLDSDSDVLPSWTLGDELAKTWFAAQQK